LISMKITITKRRGLVSKILIDTCVLSELLRRTKPDKKIRNEVISLIENDEAIIIGPIIQEILSGIKDEEKFQALTFAIEGIDLGSVISDDYINAAKFSNICRQKGIQGSAVDFLICAYAHRNECQIFTTDKDFTRYAKHLPIKLYNFHYNGQYI